MKLREKEGENSRLQRKSNKLTEVKVNKKRRDNERPLSEGGKPDDISKTFPNFSALTEAERLIFFQALTTARKNVEERGVPTRQCFGTVHDEYLKYFTQDKEEENKVPENAREPSYLTSNLVICDNNTSSCINKLGFKPRDFSDGSSRSPTTKIGITNGKGSNKVVTNEPKPWNHCESIIQKNAREMINLYLKKKEKNERKSSIVQPVNEKPVKGVGSKTPEQGNKRGNAEAERKKAKSSRTQSTAKTTLKVRDTSRFDALNAEEKEIFFRTLQKAHDNVVEKNPGKEEEILPLSAIMEGYQAHHQVMAEFHTPEDPRRREGGKRNLKVKVILTSGDNQRLSKTKSQVLSDAMREVSNRKNKSADSLHVEGQKSSRTDETHIQADQSESSFYSIGKTRKDSLEIIKKNTSELNTQNEPIKSEDVRETEENCEEYLKSQTKEKKKTKRKEKKLPKKPKTAPKPTNESKIKKKLGEKDSDSSVTAKQKAKKDAGKELKVQKKKHLEDKTKKIKKDKEKEELQEKRELLQQDLLFESKNLPSWENVDHQNMNEPEGSELLKEQCEVEAEECQILGEEEMDENCEEVTSETQTTCTNVNHSEENCEGSWWKSESEKSERTIKEMEKSDEIINEQEQQEVECRMACEEVKEGEEETAVALLQEDETAVALLQEEETAAALLQEEEKTLEVNSTSSSLRNVTTEEVGLSDLNLSPKEESTIAVKSLLLDDDDFEMGEEAEAPPKSDQVNPEPPMMETQKESIVEASVLQEVFNEASFLEEKLLEEKETKDVVPVIVDDKRVEKIKRLISYLGKKIEKDDHLEKEYFRLLVDYIDYLTLVLESLVVKEERHQKQVHETYTAAEVHLKFDEMDAESQKKENTQYARKDFIPRSISDEGLRRAHSAGSITDAKEKELKEKPSEWKSDEKAPMMLESESSSESEKEVRFAPINTGDKKLLTTNIRLLQDLLHQRAEFVEGSIADFKIIHHPEAEDFVPEEEPPAVKFLTDEDEENMQQDQKMKFFKKLLRCCTWGRNKADEDGEFENLKGEAVRADVYIEKKDDPASATLNESTVEVLKAAERKKIIEKYYSQD